MQQNKQRDPRMRKREKESRTDRAGPEKEEQREAKTFAEEGWMGLRSRRRTVWRATRFRSQIFPRKLRSDVSTRKVGNADKCWEPKSKGLGGMTTRAALSDW